jgi:hypothetical protein
MHTIGSKLSTIVVAGPVALLLMLLQFIGLWNSSFVAALNFDINQKTSKCYKSFLDNYQG